LEICAGKKKYIDERHGMNPRTVRERI
jgi:hypothetical protein